MLAVLGASYVLELCMYVPFLWRWHGFRMLFCALSLTCIASTATGFVVGFFGVGTIVLALLSVYRVINLLRIIRGQMHLLYMYRAVLRTTCVLGGLQVSIVALWLFMRSSTFTGVVLYEALLMPSLIAGLVLLITAIRRMRHTMVSPNEVNLTTKELPSVTIAIPARNETDDLYECLRSLIKNDYPKLEILVLDDCSQLRRTPEIIRSFAHDGVRFIQGDAPRQHWLPKNQAYDKLAREASGEIVIFCGVDVRFKYDTIRQIAATMISRNKHMLCVLPMRLQDQDSRTTLLQASRYFWELAPPRRLFNRPPVLSSCWAIYRHDLIKLGGFAAVSRAILPEAYFAKQSLSHDGYSFLRSSSQLSVYSAKAPAEQRETAIRTRYPQLHKRPEAVAIISIIGLACFILPYIVLAASLFWDIPITSFWFGCASIVLSSAAYSIIAIGTGTNSWYIAPFCFLPVVLSDLALIHYSLYKYEFSKVLWKGRNICIPVMHVIPHLPKL